MKFGKEIPMWEAVKILQEGGKVGVQGVLRKYSIEGKDGSFYSEGSELAGLPSNVRYYELNNTTGFATEESKEHYWIEVAGKVSHMFSNPSVNDVEYGNAFADIELAIWVSSWTKLMYNMRRFANEHNTGECGGVYYWLTYDKNHNEVCVNWNTTNLPVGTVLFAARTVAEKALEQFGQDYKELIESAPKYVFVK